MSPTSQRLAERRKMAKAGRRARQLPTGIYPACPAGKTVAPGQFIFAPPLDAHVARDAQTDAAAAVRAGLNRQYFTNTVRNFREALPPDHPRPAECVKEFERFLKNAGDWPADAPIARSPEMDRFRKQFTVKAMAKATRRPGWRMMTARMKRGFRRDVSPSLMLLWLEKYKDVPWFEGWLLRREEAPANVRVLTLEELEKSAQAFDYVGHCLRATLTDEEAKHAAGGRAARNQLAEHFYTTLVKSERIPDLASLKILWGFRQENTGPLIVWPVWNTWRLKKTREGRCTAAGISPSLPPFWEGHEVLKEVLTRAKALKSNVAAVRNEFPDIELETVKRICAYVKAETVEALSEGITTPSAYYKLKAEAEKKGVLDLLEQYLGYKEDGAFRWGKNQQTGLVAPNFFILSSKAAEFRRQAEKAIGPVNHLFELPRFEAAFEEFFLACVTPSQESGAGFAYPWWGRPTNGKAAGRSGKPLQRGPNQGALSEAAKIQRFCCAGKRAGIPRKNLAKVVREKLGRRNFEEPHVTTYADRWKESRLYEKWPIPEAAREFHTAIELFEFLDKTGGSQAERNL